MIQLGKALTNVRPVKNDAPELIVTSTKGTMKLTPKAAEALGVRPDDTLVIADFTDAEGNKVNFICKGNDWTKEALGSQGQKLAAINGKAAGYLMFSAGMAYKTLCETAGVALDEKEKATKNVHFGVTGADGETAPIEYEGQKLFPIFFSRTTDVIVHTKKEGGAAVATGAVVEDAGEELSEEF
jgi:hypothetical protein